MEPLGVNDQQKADIISQLTRQDKSAVFEDIHASVAAKVDVPADRQVKGVADFAEYVYRVDDLINLDGNKRQRDLRKKVGKFWKQHGGEGATNVQLLPLSDSSVRSQSEIFLSDWSNERLQSNPSSSLKDEIESSQKLLADFETLPLTGYALVIDGKVEGVTIGAKISNDTFATYVEKANHKIPEIYQAINHEMAKSLKQEGIKNINRMDDAGLPGLRQVKRNYNPIHQVISYTIEPVKP